MTDYFQRTLTDLLKLLGMGNPSQVGQVKQAWTNVFNGLQTHTGADGGASGVSFNGTVSSLLNNWSSPTAVPAYKTARQNVSNYAADVMSQIDNSGGASTLVGALQAVQDGLDTAHVRAKQLAAEITPLSGSTGAGVYGATSSISCQDIIDQATALAQQYAAQWNAAIRNTGVVPPTRVTHTWYLPDDAVVTFQSGLQGQGVGQAVGGEVSVLPSSPPQTLTGTGTLTVTQPSDFSSYKQHSGIPPVYPLSLTGLTAIGLYAFANEAVRMRAGQAVTDLAKIYSDTRNAVAMVHTLPTAGLPQGKQQPYTYTGGDVTMPTLTPTSPSANGVGTTGLTSTGLTGSNAPSGTPTTSGLTPTTSGLTSAGGTPMTSPATSLAGVTPTGTSGLGLTTPTSTSGLGSTGLGGTGTPITVPTTGLSPTGGGGTGGVPIAAGLMPGLLSGGTGGGRYGGLTGDGTLTGTGANGTGENLTGIPGEQLANGETAAATAAREAGTPGMMYPPMFPGAMGGQGNGNERNRGTYLPEEDVWTEDLDAVPALIVGT